MAVIIQRLFFPSIVVSSQTFRVNPEFTEFGGNGTLVWSWSLVYLGDSQLATITPNGTNEYVEYNHPDRLGTRLITNQAGGTSYEQAHLPFGKALNAESTVTNNPKRFTSYERSAPTGLDYAVNRTYDNKQGRFTQVDPIGMSASSLGSPQSLNLYTYCGNDPINHTDPSGLFWGKLFNFIKKAWKWIVVIIVVALVIASLVATHGGSAGLLGHLGTLFSKLGLAHFIAGEAFHASLGIAGKVLLGIAGVGAIANSLAEGKPKPRTPAAIRLAFFRLYGKKFNKCLKQIFGKDFKKLGTRTVSNSPVIDASLNQSQVGAKSQTGPATGSSNPGFGKFGKVYIDSGTFQGRTPNTMNAIYGTYAHETANISDIKLNPKEPSATYGRVYGDKVNPPGGDTDTGANVERCVFGSLQYP